MAFGTYRKQEATIMLVLTRKAGETVQIGDGITVTVVDLGKGRVKIGIDAPAEVAIRRGELSELPTPRVVATRREVLPITSRIAQRSRIQTPVRGAKESMESQESPADAPRDLACCPWPRSSALIAWPTVSLP